MIYENETCEWMIIEDASMAMLTAYVESDNETIGEILWSATNRLYELIQEQGKKDQRILFPNNTSSSRIVIQICPQAKFEIAKYVTERFTSLVGSFLGGVIMEKMIEENRRKEIDEREFRMEWLKGQTTIGDLISKEDGNLVQEKK